jgi:error-prone DNA polymerase
MCAALIPSRTWGGSSRWCRKPAVIGISQDPHVELVPSAATQGSAGGSPESPGTAKRKCSTGLDHELGIIRNLGFSSYFLTVAEVSRMILEMGVRAAARGSGASSLVNYLIDVSQVNPLQHDLIFERFLSRDRATLPDIDIDVESAERHNVYRDL